jgi:hypothetical protein
MNLVIELVTYGVVATFSLEKRDTCIKFPLCFIGHEPAPYIT